MSDFEINSAVHNANLREPYSLVIMGDDRIAWTKENGSQIITEKVPYSKNGVHDYCNNPADAWPIIFENGIGLRKQSNGLWVASQPGEKLPQYHKNPLRAAMLVFLMMKDEAVNTQGEKV